MSMLNYSAKLNDRTRFVNFVVLTGVLGRRVGPSHQQLGACLGPETFCSTTFIDDAASQTLQNTPH